MIQLSEAEGKFCSGEVYIFSDSNGLSDYIDKRQHTCRKDCNKIFENLASAIEHHNQTLPWAFHNTDVNNPSPLQIQSGYQ